MILSYKLCINVLLEHVKGDIKSIKRTQTTHLLTYLLTYLGRAPTRPNKFSIASTPGLATTHEDVVSVLGGYPSSDFDEQSSFSAVQCAIYLHVAFK